DGPFAIRAIRQSGGSAESASDAEIISAIRLLATTEGIFAETAGGVVVAAADKLIRSGKISADESIVLCITGNGLKTQEVVGDIEPHAVISPTFREFQSIYEQDFALQEVQQ